MCACRFFINNKNANSPGVEQRWVGGWWYISHRILLYQIKEIYTWWPYQHHYIVGCVCVCVKEMEFITHLKWVHMSISTLKWVYIVLIFLVYIYRKMKEEVNLFECLFFCCSVAVAGFITAQRLPHSDILIKIEKFTGIEKSWQSCKITLI